MSIFILSDFVVMLSSLDIPSKFLGFLLFATFISVMLTHLWERNDSTHTNLFINKTFLDVARVREVLNINKNKIQVIDVHLLGKVFISHKDLDRRIRG
jgi:hypothetical protein